MEEKIPENSDSKKQTLKDIFFEQLKKAFEDLVKSTVNARNLGIVIAVWMILSVVASIHRRYGKDENNQTLCNRTVQLDTYLMGKLLCPVN